LDEAVNMKRYFPKKDETTVSDRELLDELKTDKQDLQRIADRVHGNRKRKFDELSQAHRMFQEKAPPPHNHILQILAWLTDKTTRRYEVRSTDDQEELMVSSTNHEGFEALCRVLPTLTSSTSFDAKSMEGWTACLGKLAVNLTLHKDKFRDRDDISYSVVDMECGGEKPEIVDFKGMVDHKSQTFQLTDDDANDFVGELNDENFAESVIVDWSFDDGDHHSRTWEATYRLPLVGVNWTRLRACMEAQLSKEEMDDYLAQYEQFTNKSSIAEDEDEDEGDEDEEEGEGEGEGDEVCDSIE
jgi:hypothetical protein